MSFKFTFQGTDYSVGDTIKVNYKIKEKDKERVQAFDGIVLAITGKQGHCNILVQKSATDSIKVERVFPLDSPFLDSIKKVRSPKTKLRRSKLYFLRNARPKSRSI